MLSTNNRLHRYHAGLELERPSNPEVSGSGGSTYNPSRKSATQDINARSRLARPRDRWLRGNEEASARTIPPKNAQEIQSTLGCQSVEFQ